LKSANLYRLHIDALKGSLKDSVLSDGYQPDEINGTRIDGEQAFAVKTYAELGDFHSYRIYTSHNGLVFEFVDDHEGGGYLKEEPSGAFARMISTFRFLPHNDR
jgi:hypothetical protein